MAVSMQKGGNVSLTKEAPGIKAVIVGLGWDVRTSEGEAFDLDASVFILGADGKVRNDNDIVFYNNKVGADGAVQYQGDNTTGEGEGDDETVLMNLAGMPEDVDKVVVAVTVHEAEARGQNFGMVNNAVMRVVNAEGNVEVASFDLSEDAATETVVVFGEIYRRNSEWKFRAVGQFYKGELPQLAESYGVNVAS